MADDVGTPTDTRVVPVDAGGSGTPPPEPVSIPKPNAPGVAPAPAASAPPPAESSPAPSGAPDASLVSGGTPAPSAAPAAWPTDWQTRMANGDEKLLKRLSTYQSPKAVFDALVAAQTKISQGLKVEAPKADAKPEEIAAWRQAQGIPESPEKYQLALKTGLQVTPADKPSVDALLKTAHAAHMTPAQVNASVNTLLESRAQAREAQRQADIKYNTGTTDALNEEWGAEFRTNMNRVTNFLSMAPEGLRDKLATARKADGTLLGSDPDLLRWIVGLDLERNPAGVVVPADGTTMDQSIESEIGRIEKFMREHRTQYNRDEKMQSRYRELLNAQVTRGTRKAA